MSKPNYSSCLVQVKGKHVIPDVLLQKIVDENKSAFGIVVREPNKLVVEKFQKENLPPNLFAEVSKVVLGRKNFPTMFCFHAMPNEYDEDECQPFTAIRSSKGDPLLCVGIEGDFPNYIDTSADKFSEAYMVMNNYIGPKLEEMFKLCGNNMSKLIDYLKSAQFQTDAGNVIGHRGAFTFMPNIGEPFVIEKNELGVQGEWGEASIAYGYEEAKPVEAPPAPAADPAPIPDGPKKSKYSDAPAPESKKVEPPKAEVPAPKPTVATAVEVVEEDLTPPLNLHGKPLKQWYRKVNPSGELPDNWADRPSIRVKKTIHRQIPEETETAMVAALKAAELKKQGETMPVINGEKQKAATDYIKKHLGDGSAIIDDPVKANEDEQKLATFVQLMSGAGIKSLADLEKWRTSFVFNSVKQHPETFALAILQYRSELRDVRAKLALLEKNGEKKLGELTGSEQQTGTTSPASATTVPASPAPAPAQQVAVGGKKSRFS